MDAMRSRGTRQNLQHPVCCCTQRPPRCQQVAHGWAKPALAPFPQRVLKPRLPDGLDMSQAHHGSHSIVAVRGRCSRSWACRSKCCRPWLWSVGSLPMGQAARPGGPGSALAEKSRGFSWFTMVHTLPRATFRTGNAGSSDADMNPGGIMSP